MVAHHTGDLIARQPCFNHHVGDSKPPIIGPALQHLPHRGADHTVSPASAHHRPRIDQFAARRSLQNDPSTVHTHVEVGCGYPPLDLHAEFGQSIDCKNCSVIHCGSVNANGIGVSRPTKSILATSASPLSRTVKRLIRMPASRNLSTKPARVKSAKVDGITVVARD